MDLQGYTYAFMIFIVNGADLECAKTTEMKANNCRSIILGNQSARQAGRTNLYEWNVFMNCSLFRCKTVN